MGTRPHPGLQWTQRPFPIDPAPIGRSDGRQLIVADLTIANEQPFG